MSDFGQQLHAHGFRATSERIRLLKILCSARHPLTVDELGRKLNCSVVTVYRALSDLHRKGLVVRGVSASGTAQFSYAKKGHHHHLVCVECGFNKQCAVCE